MVSIDVLIESRMDCAPVVVLLQLLLGRGVGGRGVCGKAGASRTGAPPTCQQVGLQPRNQTSTCTQVTQSGAPGGLEVPSHVPSVDRAERNVRAETPSQVLPEFRSRWGTEEDSGHMEDIFMFLHGSSHVLLEGSTTELKCLMIGGRHAISTLPLPVAHTHTHTHICSLISCLMFMYVLCL